MHSLHQQAMHEASLPSMHCQYTWEYGCTLEMHLSSRTQSKMRLTMSGGFLRAFSATMSFEVMLLRAERAASNAGFAAARSFSASSLTAAISCTAISRF